MPLPAILAGLESLLARVAVGSVAKTAASEATQVGGKKLAGEFIKSQAAKDVTRLYRAVPGGDISSDMLSPTSGVETAKTYFSSRSAAAEQAGKGGAVLKINVPTNQLPTYSPSPLAGGGMQYQVPFVRHSIHAKPFLTNTFESAASQAESFSPRTWQQGSSIDRMYEGIRQRTEQGRDSGPNESATSIQPYQGGTSSYSSINPSDLLGMMGRSQGEIAQANAAAEVMEKKQLEANKKQIESGNQLAGVFTALAMRSGGPIGAAITGTIFAAQMPSYITARSGSQIQEQIDRYAMYSPEFATMRTRRQIQDIQLARAEARTLAPTSQELNRAQMEGREILSDIRRDLAPLGNMIATAFQDGANTIMKSPTLLTALFGVPGAVFSAARDVGRAVGGDIPKDVVQENFAERAIKKSVLAQNDTRDEKRRKPLPPIK